MLILQRSIACVLGVLLSGTLAAGPVWTEQGPGPILRGQAEGLPNNPVSGSINAIAVDLTHPGVMYLGATNGGIWKTTNGNSANPSWAVLTDQSLPALSINSIAISPLDANAVFAGTGSTSSDGFDGSPGIGVARSTDGGTSWSLFATSTFAGRRINSIVPTIATSGGLGGQVVLAATLFDGGGVYRSIDGGMNFIRISGSAGLPGAGVSSMVPDPSNPMRIYAALPANYGAGAAAGVYRSDDAGANWVSVSSGLTGLPASERILVAVGRSTAVAYAMVVNGAGTATGVFRSVNGGASWVGLGVPSPTMFAGQQGQLHGSIAADPLNPNVVFVAGDRQALPSANGCANFSANVFRGDASLPSPWQNVVCSGASGTSPHADSRRMEFDSNGNLLQANDGGIYRLDNPNLSIRRWTSLNNDVRPTELHSVAYDPVGKIVFGGAQDTGSPMQNSAGNFTWTEFLQADGGVVAVDAGTAGSSIRYTSFQFLGSFNRSTWSSANVLQSGPNVLGLHIVAGPGSGSTLFQFDPNIQFYTPYVLNAIDPTRMLIGTANVYESRDKGDTLANLGFTGQFITSVSYGSRQNGVPQPDAFYVGTRGAVGPYIRHRATAAAAMTPLNAYPGSSVRNLVMDPQNARKVYVVDDQSRVWASFDEGVTWRNLTANLPALLSDARTVEIFSPDAGIRNTVLLVGGLGGVFQMRRPDAAGTSWIPLSANLPHGLVLDLHYNYADDVLAAAILGRGAWTLSSYFRGGGGAGTALTNNVRAAKASALNANSPLGLSEEMPSAPPPARAQPAPAAPANL